MALPDKTFHKTIRECPDNLTRHFSFTENIFREIEENELEQLGNSLMLKKAGNS